MSAWEAQGLNIVMAELIVDNPQSNGPPDLAAITQWRDEYGLNSVYIAADTTVSMAIGGSIGTPTATVVDPRTMLVTERFAGSGETAFTAVENLAIQNRAQ